MPWPIVLPSGTRTNTTPNIDTHADDHNKFRQALTDLSAVLDSPSRVIKWGGGPYSTSQSWNIGGALPNFPYNGVVVLTAGCRAGFGSANIDLLFDAYSDGISATEAGVGWGVASMAGFPGYNGAVANPGISPYMQIQASVWGQLGSLTVLAPVAAAGKPNLRVRVGKGASGSNFYVDGYAMAIYLPGATIPTSFLAPS